METISQLARHFGLSRGTLLHYDKIGLLKASARTTKGYRRYSEGDKRRLELICLYRDAGVSLDDIRRILDGPRQSLTLALERRLADLQKDLSRIRRQQDVIIRILQRPDLAKRYRGLDKAGWVELLNAAGLDGPAMMRWHAEFERMAPEAHQEFLQSLRIPAREIRRIRCDAASGAYRSVVTP